MDGVTHPLPAPFAVIATQNPVGSAGTQLLPQAQLDRFMVCLEMGYPDFDSQVNILRDRQQEDPPTQVETVSSAEELLQMQQQAQSVHMDDALLAYVTRLAEATRTHPLVLLGVSPRGALAVCRMSKSRAFMYGRDYVLPEDVQAVFADVCAHRLILAPRRGLPRPPPPTSLLSFCSRCAAPIIFKSWPDIEFCLACGWRFGWCSGLWVKMPCRCVFCWGALWPPLQSLPVRPWPLSTFDYLSARRSLCRRGRRYPFACRWKTQAFSAWPPCRHRFAAAIFSRTSAAAEPCVFLPWAPEAKRGGYLCRTPLRQAGVDLAGAASL
ncbi:MAG: AAA family ATPase [Oscillospiraceae bacterium]